MQNQGLIYVCRFQHLDERLLWLSEYLRLIESGSWINLSVSLV